VYKDPARQREWIRNWKRTHRAQLTDYQRRWAYGLKPGEYEEMYQKQNGRCAICQRPQSRTRLCVDHDHATERVRALLCGECNRGLGAFKDNQEVLKRALHYLCIHSKNYTPQG